MRNFRKYFFMKSPSYYYSHYIFKQNTRIIYPRRYKNRDFKSLIKEEIKTTWRKLHEKYNKQNPN